MIVVKLMGGLGNQMFQYAAGRQLALWNKTELYLDLSFLQSDPKGQYTQRQYELDAFSIKAWTAPNDVLKKFVPTTSFAGKVLRKLGASPRYKTLNEIGHLYQKKFTSIPNNTLIVGFWQCEKYFIGIRNQLIKEFTPVVPLDENNALILERIRNCNSVSLHIRRGDYSTLEAAKNYHGLLSLEYYRRALKVISSKEKNLEVFVFSDDLVWAEQNLNLEFPSHYVSGNSGKNGYKDLVLMKNCKHNIMANSSFSWWGAWLNENPSKLVVAPKQWVADPKENFADIYSKDFIILD